MAAPAYAKPSAPQKDSATFARAARRRAEFREAEAPLRRAAAHLFRAYASAVANGQVGKLRTVAAIIRLHEAESDLGLAESAYMSDGDKAAARRALNAGALALHVEAGALIGPKWEFSTIASHMAHDARWLLHDALRALGPDGARCRPPAKGLLRRRAAVQPPPP